MLHGIPENLAAPAVKAFCKDGDDPSLTGALADLHLTGGQPRRDVQPLAPGPSIQVTGFVERWCMKRHGSAPHDLLACIQTAYYERLARDRAKLAQLAAQRGEYGTPAQFMTQNSSTKPRQTQILTAWKAVQGGVPAAPPLPGRITSTGETPCPTNPSTTSPTNPNTPTNGGAQ